MMSLERGFFHVTPAFDSVDDKCFNCDNLLSVHTASRVFV